ncbi:NUDIX hydrolase [Nocardioides ferulae]|uniref:NUDIX hydrolase n=1 Tax=Nocardioides ferulae TaxID=2340821 RepID=UPI000EB07434|nr:NUDIX hydrolase [Nocardioides ferulae]
MAPPDVLAAGAVVFRPGREVLLVHRPRYDDWAFPKGKLDRGEHRTAAALREVVEETGVRIRLGRPLADQRYETGGRMKTVHYWVARPVGDHDVDGYQVNDEIDDVRWVPVDEAERQLTYPHDRETLAEALAARKRTQPLLVVRHGLARSRRTWRGDDRLRPLVQAGQRQALRLAPVFAAYDVARVVSSGSVRCTETVAPYAEQSGRRLRTDDRLSEEDATAQGVRAVVEATVEKLVAKDQGGLLCTHRPVLPLVFDALGLEDPQLEKGELLVVHLRQGTVAAIERHSAG